MTSTPSSIASGQLTAADIETWDPAAPTAGPLGDLAEAMRTLDADLFAEIVRIARTPQLLVATDYDGTIAPIVERPSRAYPLPLSLISMRALSALPDTHAAVISGRSLRDLAAMSRLPREVTLVGSHGAETTIDTVETLDETQQTALAEVRRFVFHWAMEHPEINIEFKPTGAAIHFRGLEEQLRQLTHEAVENVAKHPSVHLMWGREVVDITVVTSDKGQAITDLMAHSHPTATLYIGDDVSDEPALGRLTENDIAIKVATPDTQTVARFIIPDPETVAVILSSIFELRRSWLFGRAATPIERHSLLANGNSTALIDPAGSICWMPHPLPHSASLFSEILGSSAAGYFSVTPVTGGTKLTQRYQPNSTIVETRWAGLTLSDYLAPVDEHSQDTILVRVLTGDAPSVIRFAPRPDFGSYPTRLDHGTDGSVQVVGTSEPIVLYAPGVDFDIVAEDGSDTAVAHINPSSFPDSTVVVALVCGTSTTDIDALLTGQESTVRARAARYWHDWVRSLRLPDLKTDEVARSAIVLRSLCHKPTGGILAAATSSLPEGIGGIRNWDYRYTWVRDGAMTARALVNLGSTTEAADFLQWLRRILSDAAGPEQLHPLYAVDGSALTTEAVLEHLPGYAGSRPVRVGNAAEHQVQLDVFGAVAELIQDYTAETGELSDHLWSLTEAMVTAVSRRWNEADHGIWEARREPKHNVYTRVMCWVTVDRALQIGKRFSRTVPHSWHTLREEIAQDVLHHGFNEQVGAFTVAYGEDDLDAACLFIGLSGLLPGDDPRFISTVDAIERELRVGPTVFRYHYDDGLPGLEGGFHICTTWLIEAFLLTGRYDDAIDLFRRLDALMGPTGLYSEEYDPVSETHLGNHPQAYSHLGYIRVAQLLDTAMASGNSAT